MNRELAAPKVLACEIDPRKQAWIRVMHEPAMLLDDMCLLAKGQATDHISGRKVDVAPEMDLCVVGFSCKDLSRLSSAFRNKTEILEAGAGTSGSTFQALLTILGRMPRKPAHLLLENVTSLSHGRNLSYLQRSLRDLGYTVTVHKLCPTQFGVPQRHGLGFGAVNSDSRFRAPPLTARLSASCSCGSLAAPRAARVPRSAAPVFPVHPGRQRGRRACQRGSSGGAAQQSPSGETGGVLAP